MAPVPLIVADIHEYDSASGPRSRRTLNLECMGPREPEVDRHFPIRVLEQRVQRR